MLTANPDKNMRNAHIININITYRNTEATEALDKHVNEKIRKCLEKFVHTDTKADVVLRVEKNRQIAEISAHVNGSDIKASSESDSLYSAVDLLVDTVKKQLAKVKEKLVEKR